MDPLRIGVFIVAIGSMVIFGISVGVALVFPGYWPTYEIIIKNYTYPGFLFGAGLLTGAVATSVQRTFSERKSSTPG